MNLNRTFEESEAFAEKLLSLIDLPPLNDTHRIELAIIACSLSLEHWHSIRFLLNARQLPSAVVVHRAQFEAIVRSIWLTYCASESDLCKLTAQLNIESEQAAKNISQIQNMMDAIDKSAPAEAFAALSRFKNYSWKALNSYAHAGIHPIARHAAGYPDEIIEAVLCNANSLAGLCGMQAVVLCGRQPLQKQILELAAKYPSCMPPPL